MMKSKKLIVAMILMVTFLSLMVTCVKADNEVFDMPVITTDKNQTTNNNKVNEPIISNNQTVNNQVANTNDNNTNANTDLPQTGVAGDTTLFVFITICIVSAVYACVRIKKYNDVH